MRLPGTRKPNRLPETPDEAIATVLGAVVQVLILRGVLPPEARREISDEALASLIGPDDGTLTGKAARAKTVVDMQDLLRPWLEWSNLPWPHEQAPEPDPAEPSRTPG